MENIKNLDKNQKIALAILPIFIVGICIFAYPMFFDTEEKTEVGERGEGNLDLNVDDKEEKKEKTKLELYRDKSIAESNNKALYKSGHVNQGDFYALDNSETEDLSEEDELDMSTATDPYGDIPPSQRPNNNRYKKTAPVVPQKTAPARVVQKQKIVYRDRPVRKATPVVVIAPPVVVEKKRRGRGNTLGSLSYQSGSSTTNSNMIECYIDNDNNEVRSGSMVSVVISKASVIGGYSVPAGTIVTGKASVSGDRCFIEFNKVMVGKEYINIAFVAFDVDGTKGIKVSSDDMQKVKDDVADQATSGSGITVQIPVIGGSLSTGSLKKAKEAQSVVLIDRHRILLRSK